MKITFKTEKQKNPTQNDGFSIFYAPAKRIAFKMRWYLLLALILSPLVIFSWYMLNDKVLVTAAGILTTEPITLDASQNSFVEKVLVKGGDKVEQGQVLIKLSSPEIEKEIAILTSKYNKFKTYYNEGYKTLDSLHLRQIATYKNAKSAQESINTEFSEYNKQGMLPLNDRLAIEQNSVLAETKYQEALIERETVLAAHKNGQLANTLLELELALSEAKVKRDLLSIRAPKAAVVNDVMAIEGEHILNGNSLISISNLAEPVINVYLAPERMDFAQIGQSATITLPNGDEYIGTVNRPTQMSQKMPSILAGPFDGNKSALKVTLDITDAPEFIFEGLLVDVRFHYISRD
ncbi:HlyD family secretion protein [Thalassomonas sp. M1454]|uniref:HlyD family secretion protein n=1 Tax=Thalassomonas sp. M1454 TaxID=2594477 RepID=UPI00117DC713|nr:HlyD family secretion protein [Thalassomonas sp. M1454]TRX56986.1 biotin/lipoyl-binding protein [Thalassomonas sp. M1454]